MPVSEVNPGRNPREVLPKILTMTEMRWGEVRTECNTCPPGLFFVLTPTITDSGVSRTS